MSQNPGSAKDRPVIHGQNARHGKDASPPLRFIDLEALVHGSLPLDPPGLVKGGQSLGVITIKTRSALVYESDVGIEKFHNRTVFSKKVMEKIAGLGTHGMQMNGVVLDLIVDGRQP